MFPPIPNPLTIVVESTASEPSWWQSWGPTLVPLLVSLVALGGVIYAQWKTGKNMITAERERARLAEAAEDKRARNAIEAEDRRAAAAIEAEDRRHEYAIRQSIHAHVVDNTRDLYTEIEAVRSELDRATWAVAVLSVENVGTWLADGSKERDRYVRAAGAFSEVDDRSSLFGSTDVARLTGEIFASSFHSERLLMSVDSMEPPIAPEIVGEIVKSAKVTRQKCAELLLQMRRELHVTDRAATT